MFVLLDLDLLRFFTCFYLSFLNSSHDFLLSLLFEQCDICLLLHHQCVFRNEGDDRVELIYSNMVHHCRQEVEKHIELESLLGW
jgi:hypothetical protein